jgi:hypothetical protein
MKERHRILGVHVTDRVKRAGDVQALFSEYGCNIRTRLGLHQVDEGYCSPDGLILLELFGNERACDALRDKLGAIVGVEVKEMVFEHPA